MELFKYLTQRYTKEWNSYINHPFVNRLVTNQLNPEKFDYYLAQDHLYLIDYKRAHHLLLTKQLPVKIAKFVETIINTLLIEEMQEQDQLLTQFTTTPSLITEGYTSHFYKLFISGDWRLLFLGLSTCSIGYCYIGQQLKTQWATLEHQISNPKMKEWAHFYQNEALKNKVDQWITYLNEFDTTQMSREELQMFETAFCTSIRWECAFFDQAINDMVLGHE